MAHDGQPLTWPLIREGIDGYATALLQFVGATYGKSCFQQAWREFTFASGEPFIEGGPHTEVFFSWLFHCWAPAIESGYVVDDDTLFGVPPTRAYLLRHEANIAHLLRRYLEACLASSFAFYEVVECTPDIGFDASELLTGVRVAVTDELASTTLASGDIVFAHLVSMNEVTVMDAISPVSFPPTYEQQLAEGIRQAESGGERDTRLRQLYFRALRSLSSGV